MAVVFATYPVAMMKHLMNLSGELVFWLTWSVTRGVTAARGRGSWSQFVHSQEAER